MTQNPTKKEGASYIPTKPTLHTTITFSKSYKWKGCVYYAPCDSTGQVLKFLKDISANYSGLFFRNPIFVFVSNDKAFVEKQMNDKIKSLIKKR